MRTRLFSHLALISVVAAIAAVAMCPVTASAQAASRDTRSGCVVKDGDSFTFVEARRKSERAEPLTTAIRPRLVGSCHAGKSGTFPAAVYDLLASKNPSRFRPLHPAAANADSLAVASPTLSRTMLQEFARYWYIGYDLGQFGTFGLAGIDGKGRAFTTVVSEPDFLPKVAMLENRQFTILVDGQTDHVNRSGTNAGFIVTDPVNFYTQAALFRNHAVEVIPRQTDEIISNVIALNDNDEALFLSIDSNFSAKLFLYAKQKVIPVDLGMDPFLPFLWAMNNDRTIVYTLTTNSGDRGQMRDWKTGKVTQLDPIEGDLVTWTQGINNRGDVLGYSYTLGGTEHVGMWQRNGKFRVHFEEGTKKFPTISNHLSFNEDNVIVISDVSSPALEAQKVYLVPRPGIRVNVADLLIGMPNNVGGLGIVAGINNAGEIAGQTKFSRFDLNEPYILKIKGIFDR